MHPAARPLVGPLALATLIAAPGAASFPFPVAQHPPASPPPAEQEPVAAPRSELDRFMARVLKKRDSWKRLGDFVFREIEVFELEAPSLVRFSGFRREYEWFVHDELAVRSPVRFDGVQIGEARRRRYEEEWIGDEEERRASGQPEDLEPHFINDFHYFLETAPESGHSHYLAGQETLAGREVVRIERYPTDTCCGDPGQDEEERIERAFERTSFVTFWVDPELHQLVKYTFRNPGPDFLPGRWLLRVEGLEASLELAPVGETWMPSLMTFSGRVATALGESWVRFRRELFDYREAEVRTRILGTRRRR